MMNAARRLAVALVVTAAAASPALADDVPVTHTDQLVVVTPNPPVVVTNGAPTAAPSAAPGAVDAEAPPAPAARNDAPQNESWSDVNHINGTLVKVGEKNEYLLRYRKTNIATNPIGWLAGFYGVSVSHALGQNVAIRGDANLITIDGSSMTELGVSLPIYFRRVYSGPFIEPGIITRSFDSESCDYYASGGTSCMSTTETTVGPEVLFGWHWMFDSGLNVAMAFGLSRDLSTESSDGYDSGPEILPAGYFRIGYAF